MNVKVKVDRPITCRRRHRAVRDVIGLLILNLCASEWPTSRTGRFSAGKEPLYPLYRRLEGPRGNGQEKDLLPLTGIRTPDCPARSR